MHSFLNPDRRESAKTELDSDLSTQIPIPKFSAGWDPEFEIETLKSDRIGSEHVLSVLVRHGGSRDQVTSTVKY